MKSFLPSLLAISALFLPLATGFAATEYFVGPQGDDSNSGASRESAFASVQMGVDTLQPGDTLTILPGQYHGTVYREDLGSAGAKTHIRAEIPGTVVLRGDLPAPEFQPVEGFQFVYAADFDGETEVQAVNEQDTLTVLRRLLNPAELEFSPGSFYQDREAGRLYISTSDLRDPAQHRYTLSVTPAHGIYLLRPQSVVIEGLGVTGFNNAAALHHRERTHGATFGIFLTEANDSIVRDCRAWFNGRGIGMNPRQTGGNNLITHCMAWVNHGIGGGGALTMFEPNNDRIAHSQAFLNGRIGALIYIGDHDGELYKTLSWGNNTDVQLKADQNVIANHSIGLSEWGADSRTRRAEHSLIGHIREPGDGYRDNIILSDYPDLDLNAEFADPANHDFRLQSTSGFRGQASNGGDLGPFPYEPDIYYLSNQGDDSADGLSVANAWQTIDHALERLTPGDTLYLEPGEYTATTTLKLSATTDDDAPVAILGRGHAPVIIHGHLSIEASQNIRLARLNFTDSLALSNCEDVSLENCRFLGEANGLEANSVEGLRIAHGLFTNFSQAAITLTNTAGVFLHGNFFNNSDAPAVRFDDRDAILYSDYNGFASEHDIVVVNGDRLGMPDLQAAQETFSVVAEAEFTAPDGLPSLTPQNRLRAAGPYGTSLGLYNPAADFEKDEFLLAGPYVHSVTATTANLEWWTSDRADLTVGWGVAGDDGNNGERRPITSDRAGSYSLTGLEPDTDYFFELFIDGPVQPHDADDDVKWEGDRFILSFRTAAQDPEAAVYYVATDGDDARDGLSRETAWRTVNHAASAARPGDTILIAGGAYHEAVRIRATGDEGRPITFAPVPGEKVVFDGFDRNLTYSFYGTNKAWIHIDGFYFTDLGRGGITPWTGSRNGAVTLYNCRHIDITRCFLDGRGSGPYSPGLLQAHDCADLLVRNCVIFSSMGGGIGFSGTPNMRIENNVFFRNFISHISEIINTEEQPFYIRNNIFTDNLPGKVGGNLLNIGRVESMWEDNNCFYVRLPIEERRLIMIYDQVAYERAAAAYGVEFDPEAPYKVEELRQWTLPQFQERFHPESTSFAADPLFAGSLDLDRVEEDGQPAYIVEQLLRALNSDDSPDLDFNILFATNPEVTERGIGLQPEAFADFHFQSKE